MTSLSEPILTQVVTYTSSKAVWNALDDTFSSRSRVRILQIRTQLATATKGSKTAIDYFHYIKRLTDELAVAGQPLNHDDITTYILAGLSHEYDSFVASIPARTDDITLEEIYSLLLTSKARLSRHQLTPIIQQPSANIVYRQYNLPRRGGFRAGGVPIVVVIIPAIRIMINHLLFARYVVRSNTLLRNAIFALIYLTRKHLLYQQSKVLLLCVTTQTMRGTLHGMQIQEPHIILPMMLTL